ncbi:MAG TPA: LytTR family DNA-binding domain-containing protein [Gammaproteobacteria bacterium]|nr:LytTR family DNA-binding domain-containing protein [Gammaproteobacteria bacterium]
MSAASYKLIIVDDEQPARERLELLLAELPDWCVVGSCGTGSDALELAQRLEPHAVLLDIRMPGMSGIEAARHMAAMATPPAVVFTTAYDRYAIEAFEAQAIGYLLKPVRLERLRQALGQAARLSAVQLREIVRHSVDASPRRHIAARLGDQLRLIPLADVALFRADQKYVSVIHAAGEDLIDESLRDLAEEFADTFVRVHRSVLVNAAHIEALDRDADGKYLIRLRQRDETLPVSRRQVGELKRFLRAGARPA